MDSAQIASMGFIVGALAGFVVGVVLRKRGATETKATLVGLLAGVVVWLIAWQILIPVAIGFLPARSVTVPVYETTAVQLLRDYNTNEVATDANISGKWVYVSGRVASIDRDLNGNIVVRLATGNEVDAAEMMLYPSEAAKAAALHKGDDVHVLCEFMQRRIGSPFGTNCLL